jgi:hypothetical protein
MPLLMVRNKAEPLTVYSLRGLMGIADEIILHLPCKSGRSPVTLIRRLADKSFIILHPADCDLGEHALISELVEWPAIDLGKPKIIQVLQTQAADGVLMRSQVSLPDTDLKGMLGNEAIACAMSWEHMGR